jgi:hypothetical protein
MLLLSSGVLKKKRFTSTLRQFDFDIQWALGKIKLKSA